MKFSDLVSNVWERDKHRQDLLIIMPVFTEYDVLFEHLRLLSQQTFQKFDLIIILGNAADEKKVIAHIKGAAFKFNCIVAKRKEDTGPAGGFFTGQKYALENGYGFVIFAESDCFPIDTSLVDELYKSRESGYAAASTSFFEGEKELFRGSGMNYYTLLSRQNMLRYGLYFMPAHIGSEDIEYSERIREKKALVQSRCQHPFNSTTRYERIFDKQFFYILNTMCIQQRATVISAFTVRFLAVFYAMLFFSPPYGRRLAARLLGLMFSFTYGRAGMEKVHSGYGEFISKKESIPNFENFRRLNYNESKGALAEPFYVALQIAKNFRKDVVVENSLSITVFSLLALGCRTEYLKVGDGSYLLMAKNGNILLHACKIAIFILSLAPFLALASALFFALKLARQPRTMGYGLD